MGIILLCCVSCPFIIPFLLPDYGRGIDIPIFVYLQSSVDHILKCYNMLGPLRNQQIYSMFLLSLKYNNFNSIRLLKSNVEGMEN